MNNSAIGVFDSGMGGLTCVKELSKIMPCENIIYFGPMGCRTGFYLLTSGLSHTEAICLILETVRFIADYEGKIPGTEPRECGNCREHDLAGAKKLCADYYEKVKDWTEEKLAY